MPPSSSSGSLERPASPQIRGMPLLLLLLACAFGGSMGALTWNGDWALGCDFPGNDLPSVTTPSDSCGRACAATEGCTSFTWNRGTCFLKNGAVRKEDAVEIADKAVVCGVVPRGILWQEGDWAFNCDFPGNDLKILLGTSNEACGAQCAATTGCTSFLARGGVCNLKKGAVTRADAVSLDDAAAVCGIVASASGTPGSTPTPDPTLPPAAAAPFRPGLRSWLPKVSSDTGEVECGNGFITGLICEGDNCGDLIQQCTDAEKEGPSTWTPWFSNEGPDNFQHCSTGAFVSGMKCSGERCTSVSLQCTKLKGAVQLWDQCFWSNWVSEETDGGYIAPDGYFVKGAQCENNFCDDVALFLCPTSTSLCQGDQCVALKARTFAPLLRFDSAAEGYCFPSSAADYWASRKAGSTETICNENYEDIEQGAVPIYYTYKRCGDTDIFMYWFFYGNQFGCVDLGWPFGTTGGKHDSDWERVAVRVEGGRITKVQFYQHNGWYTKQAGSFSISEGTHPWAYVGKIAHGSYHDEGGTPGNFFRGVECGYWEDYRKPGKPDMRMKTWLNLVPLTDGSGSEDWMRDVNTEFIEKGNPLSRGVDLCNLPACHGSNAKTCVKDCGCYKSEGSSDELF